MGFGNEITVTAPLRARDERCYGNKGGVKTQRTMPEPSETDAARKANKEKEESNSEGVPPTKSTPDGIVPLFFSGPGQQIFGCVADSDVTVESPHKLIAKEMILEDFKNRAAVSDFHPVKKAVMVRLHTAGLGSI